MKLYIRKIFKHDVDHEVNVKKEIVKTFFDDKREFNILGKKSNFNAQIQINNATDYRFGGDFKNLLKNEGGYKVDDLILIYNNGKNYKLEIIDNKNQNYYFYSQFFSGLNRHYLLFLEDEPSYPSLGKLNQKPHQRIFFGAPGTGKSYFLNQEARKYFGNNYRRVTFHPNYLYSHFVGMYKPTQRILYDKDGSVKTDEDGNYLEVLSYQYVPGVLLELLIEAYKNPSQNYLLIIEEINRANPSLVFGDIIQLLDRNSNGESEYFINPNYDLKKYLIFTLGNINLDQSVKEKLGEDFNNLYLPHNLYLWATMNSSDQSVHSIDSAFKRRWEIEYFGVDDIADKNKEIFDNYYFKSSQNSKVKWDDYRRIINKRLLSLRINEDKLIGSYFIPKNLLETCSLDSITTIIKNKLMMYLYEDVARMNRTKFFNSQIKSYADLIKIFDDNALEILSTPIEIEKIEIKVDEDLNITRK